MNQGPVSLRILDEAIAWQLRLGSGETKPDDEADFALWHAAHSEHARAWRQLGMLDRNLGAAVSPAARGALLRAPSESRRRLRRLGSTGLALLLAAGLALGVGNRYMPLRFALADIVTSTGELREMRLPDNTLLQLDSRTAVDVRFDTAQRRIVLLQGEIFVQTAHGDPRPFIVETRDGRLQALGTRFLVERRDDGTLLTVLQSAVAARPSETDGERIVQQGRHLMVHANGFGDAEDNSPTADAWTHGMLVVDNLPLGELIQRLGRYRSGYLGLDPSLANLRITGSFSLRDTDLALRSLEPSLPVRIERHSAWWTEVVPRG
ncbi:MAG: Protein FecR [Stenotrophomonas maltophilia]|nr:MAG: Protein FecR [Stenotrophomonas maltophilia]